VSVTSGLRRHTIGAGHPPGSVEEQLYHETAAGGFSRVDHRMAYLVRVHALLEPSMTVLDFGAGRGKWEGDPAPFRRRLGQLRGKCRRIVGADVDSAILKNEQVDERVHLVPGEPLPFPDETFDMILAFSVFEHVEDPGFYAPELTRVLRPGGWIVAWTPNRSGYVGLLARLIPRFLHGRVLRLVEPRRHDGDSFIPLYRLNDRRAFKRYFPKNTFTHYSYTYSGQPFYHAECIALARMWQLIFRVSPPTWQGYWMIILCKKSL